MLSVDDRTPGQFALEAAMSTTDRDAPTAFLEAWDLLGRPAHYEGTEDAEGVVLKRAVGNLLVETSEGEVLHVIPLSPNGTS